MELLRYFHIAEPAPVGVQHDVVHRIRPLWDHCRTVFPEYFTPPEYLTLDEIMVRFEGRSPWKTIIKIKPTPVGYKVWAIGSHGYLCTFDIYRGKGGYTVKQGKVHHRFTPLFSSSNGGHSPTASCSLTTSTLLLPSAVIYSTWDSDPAAPSVPTAAPYLPV